MLLAFSTVSAQKIPDDLKAKLKAKAAKLYPNDKHEERMWYSNQFYAWQALQSSSSALAPDDTAAIRSAADKKFPLDYVAQSTFISDQTAYAESLTAARDVLGIADFRALRKKYLKEFDNDFSKVAPEIIKQAEAKKSWDALANADAAKLASVKADAEKKFKEDYIARLAAAQKELGTAQQVSSSVAVATNSSQASAPEVHQKIESAYEKSKRLQKESMDKFLVSTCRNREDASATFVDMMENKAIIVPVAKLKDITEADLVSNLGKKVEFDKNNIYINKKEPFILVFVKEYPEGVQPVKILNEESWKKLLGKQLFLVGRLKEIIKSFPLVANSLAETSVNVDSRLPFGIGSGALYISTEDGSVGGILRSSNIPIKIPEDFAELSQVSRMVSSMRSQKVAYEVLRFDTLKDWEKLDKSKLEKQEEEYERVGELVKEFTDFFMSQTLRNLTTKKTIGRVAKRGLEELDVKRLKMDEHKKRYKSYLNGVKNVLNMELTKIKTKDFYSLRRNEMENYQTILQNMYSSLEKLIKEDFTSFMRQDSNPFRPN